MTKPCPFCGYDKGVDVVQVDVEDREGIPVCVRCPNCGADGPYRYLDRSLFDEIQDKPDVVAELTGWNKRAVGS